MTQTVEQKTSVTPEYLTDMFTQNGTFRVARWGRPVAPVVFGLADESLAIYREAMKAVFADAGIAMTETDPEMGSNFITFFLPGWDHLSDIPDLDELTGTPDLSARLPKANSDNYRLFRFDPDGSIRACFSIVNMGGALKDVPAGVLAETLAVRATLTFAREVVPSQGLAALIRAAYAPELPPSATDPAHIYRLIARLPSVTHPASSS